jgi:hypothetical protein
MTQNDIDEGTISVSWDNEQKTIQRFDFPQHWTWEDFGKAKIYADHLLDEFEHEVGVIYVLHPTNALPKNVLSVTGANFSKRHPRAVILVVVATSQFVKLLWHTLVTLYPLAKQFGRRTDTVDEAREMVIRYLTSRK